MSSPAISVEKISKAYRLGLEEEIPDTLAQAVFGWAKAPWTNFQRLRRLNTFDTASGSDEKGLIWALRDLSFDVAEGEVVGIIGRNGAGKSTLLKLLSRITHPTSGRALIRGRVSSLLEVGTGFHPELTGRENIYMNGTILGMTKREIDRKFDAIVAFSGVERFLDTPTKRYSSGMQVRLAFSVAAHLEPEILIIDEVLAVGDSEFQRKCLGKMEDVAGEGRTVLFVSHNMSAVEALCPRVICVSDGSVVADGTAGETIPFYLSQYAKTAATTDLAEHGGRRKHMTPLLTKLCFRTQDGESSDAFQIGSDMIFEVDIDPRSASYRDAKLSITLTTQMGVQVCKLATWAQLNRLWDLEAPKTVRCILRNCRLMPGNYHVSIGFGSATETIDYIEHAATFTIREADLFGTGRLGSGLIAPDAEWSVDTDLYQNTT